jgi:hypothetical protein
MEQLDQEAWERWKAYRTAIRKPIKPASEDAMKIKLQRYGSDQAAVVEQSISNQWQGLFDLKKSKPMPGEKPVKSDKQLAAEAEQFVWMNQSSEKHWSTLPVTPINRLKLCEALWARYTVTPDEHTPERLEWLKDAMRPYLRDANPKEVLGDPGLSTMVWCFFNKRGIDLLRSRIDG